LFDKTYGPDNLLRGGNCTLSDENKTLKERIEALEEEAKSKKKEGLPGLDKRITNIENSLKQMFQDLRREIGIDPTLAEAELEKS
jgi:predicted nuclease of restriction endonuclease-like RecB superfamily